MKHVLAAVLLCGLLPLRAQLLEAGHAVLDAHAWHEQLRHHPVLRSGFPASGYDVRYHRLSLTLDPAEIDANRATWIDEWTTIVTG